MTLEQEGGWQDSSSWVLAVLFWGHSDDESPWLWFQLPDTHLPWTQKLCLSLTHHARRLNHPPVAFHLSSLCLRSLCLSYCFSSFSLFLYVSQVFPPFPLNGSSSTHEMLNFSAPSKTLICQNLYSIRTDPRA